MVAAKSSRASASHTYFAEVGVVASEKVHTYFREIRMARETSREIG